MNPDYLEDVVDAMRDCGVQFAGGLDKGQIEAAEAAHGFHFPPDLRALLEHALPIGDGFPDWRNPNES